MFLGREELWGVPTVRGKGRNTQTPNHPGRTRIPVLLPSGMKLEKVSVLWSHVSFSLKCSSTVNIVIWKYHQIYLTTLTTVPGPKSLTCVCGGGGFPRISRQRSGHQLGVSHFNSDTVYPEILSDFTGWGSNPINCLPTPLQAPVISLGCFLCFWPKDYKLKAPMTCPRLLKMPITSLGCSVYSWPIGYKSEVPTIPSFGLNHLLEQPKKLRKPIHSLDDCLIMQWCNSGDSGWKSCTVHGMGKGCGKSLLSLGALPPQTSVCSPTQKLSGPCPSGFYGGLSD